MNLPTQPYKGARDFYPKEKRVQNYIFSKWREVVEKFGYEEYDAPLIEPTDLYTAKSGEEIVDKQTYRFEDRGGRDVSIRPEMTPTVARMVAGQRQELGYPLRWYSIPNLWRYERPQKGRLREHWQLNVDIFGVKTIDAELELIMIADQIMKSVGATQNMFKIKINSRKLTILIMAEYLELDTEGSNAMIKLLDKKDKLDNDAFKNQAMQIFPEGKSEVLLKKLQNIIDAKSLADLPDIVRESQAMRQIQILFTHLKENNISNAVFDVTLMRGFDYYTDIVFEVFDNHPDNSRSLFGGGRYDGLVGLFGVDSVPTVGFGLGDVTFLDFLETHELIPELDSTTQIYIVTIGEVLRQSQGIANILRSNGLKVAVDIVSNNKVEKQIKNADKKAISHVLFVGERELNEEKFNLKNLSTGQEDKLSLSEIIEKFNEKTTQTRD